MKTFYPLSACAALNNIRPPKFTSPNVPTLEPFWLPYVTNGTVDYYVGSLW